MMGKPTTYLIIVVVSNLLACPVTEAGSSQAARNPGLSREAIAAFAKQFERALADKAVRVAIVGRVGRPRSTLPEGVSYTHTAFAVYSQITTDDGRTAPGYAFFNLYQRADQADKSELVIDYPFDFFAGVDELEAGVMVPVPKLQARLASVIASPLWRQLHVADYSVIANPFDPTYQNCTEHMLDVITAAIYDMDDLRRIKANQKAYFEPYEVRLGSLTLMLGSLFSAGLTTADHDGAPVTATFDSLARYLEKYALLEERFVILPAGDGGSRGTNPALD